MDQEQHDAVRDVFAVPGGATLIRADLFAAIGGYDDGIVGLGDDVDLCWRAHVVGARVLIAPAARVRHLEAFRHRWRWRQTVVARRPATASAPRWWPTGAGTGFRVLPQAAFFTVIEALYAVVSGHGGQAQVTS